MTTEIIKSERKWCIVTFSGVELWIPEEKVDLIRPMLNSKEVRFLDIKALGIPGDKSVPISISGIEGIYPPESMEERRAKRRGMWICKFKNQHERNEKCECTEAGSRQEELDNVNKKLNELMSAEVKARMECEKDCDGGYFEKNGHSTICSCIKSIRTDIDELISRRTDLRE